MNFNIINNYNGIPIIPSGDFKQPFLTILPEEKINVSPDLQSNKVSVVTTPPTE